jgi:hypothetical protein
VAQLRAIALQVRAFGRLVADAPADFRNAARSYLDRIVRETRALIAGLSIADKAGLAGAWNDLVKPARDRLLARIGVQDFKDRLGKNYDDIVTAAANLRTALGTATADSLVNIVESAVALADPDRRLAGLIIETVALGTEAREKVERVAFGLTTGAAKVLYALHTAALVPLKALSDLGTRHPEIKYLLDGFTEFQGSVRDVERDMALLDAVARATGFDDALAKLADLKTAWPEGKPIALSRAAGDLVRYIDAILRGKFGNLLGQAVREQFVRLEKQLRDMIAEFVPAAIQTRYDWTTPLKKTTSELIQFKMTGTSTDDDLTLKTVIDFNFITGRRNVAVTGELKPFMIGISELFTISFKRASFTSVNGSSPDFQADVSDVILGDALKFLEQIRQVLAPSGNGVYVAPRLDGIRVGYGFARDQMQLGSLTLSNIALDVYADLPFGPQKAEFGFLFASAARPFLISQAPYGGGGWVALTFGGNNGTRVALSFMFGAVTDIKFGPLSGFGRICAGIIWTGKEITTFIEAVGEGNIACFSISIYIGFFLKHNMETGSLHGTARFSYKFKVGFVSFHYSVTAERTIKGSNDGSAAIAPRGALAAAALSVLGNVPGAAQLLGPPMHSHKTAVPPKSRKWGDYKRRISLELLNA